MADVVPFDIVGGHLLSVPARVGGSADVRLLFDTGIGVSVLSSALAAAAGCRPTGETFTGRRMSGQEVVVPLSRLGSLELGSHRASDVPVGILDLLPPRASRPAGFAEVEGIVSPGLLDGRAFTLDGPNRSLVLEDDRSMADRLRRGTSIPLRVDRTGPAVDLFVDLDLPSGSRATVEVDTGSGALTLHSRYMLELGVRPGDPGVRTVEGVDETHHAFTRHFARIDGPVRFSGAPTSARGAGEVMFQEIIYDGLVGSTYLLGSAVTFDPRGSRAVVPTVAP